MLFSERKWKEKLKEWGFEKYVPAKEMNFITAVAEKRSREGGKETVFFRRGVPINSEKIEQFKRRKITGHMACFSSVPGQSVHASSEIQAGKSNRCNRDTTQYYLSHTPNYTRNPEEQ
jgi:hypothetical protein